MKKLSAVITLLILFAVALADIGDQSITITIPADKIAEIVPGFLREKPIPQIPDPSFVDDPNDPEDYAPMIDKYTAKEHIKRVLVAYGLKMANRGNIKIASDSAIKSTDGMQ